MAEPQKSKQPVGEHDDLDLRGTLVSVSFVGLVIILSWAGVWSIFVSR